MEERKTMQVNFSNDRLDNMKAKVLCSETMGAVGHAFRKFEIEVFLKTGYNIAKAATLLHNSFSLVRLKGLRGCSQASLPPKWKYI